MVQNVNPIFILTPRNSAVKITAGDTTTKVSAFVAGADGAILESLSACNFGVAPVTVVLSVNNGVASHQIGEIVVPAGAGTDGATAPARLLDTTILKCLDLDNRLVLQAGYVVEVAAKATVASNVDVLGAGGDF